MIKTVPSSTLREHLSDVLKEAASQKKSYFIVTKKNQPTSVIVNIDFFEDLLAATSPSYLKSIKEARKNYKDGDVFSHEEVFGSL